MKTFAHILFVSLLGFASTQGLSQEIRTLRAGPGAPVPSQSGGTYRPFTNFTASVSIGANEVVEILHFICLGRTGPVPSTFISPSRGIWLTVNFGDIKTTYDYFSIHGAITGDGINGPYNGSGFLRPVVFRGPATLQLEERQGSGSAGSPESEIDSPTAIVTIKISAVQPAASSLSSDKDSVVIPEGVGPVDVLLESSTDLKRSWQGAPPGIYGRTDAKRFFRVRAALREQ
jgi:hypothetical protein